MTERQKALLPLIADGLDPNKNDRHAFVAGTIYGMAVSKRKEAVKND